VTPFLVWLLTADASAASPRVAAITRLGSVVDDLAPFGDGRYVGLRIGNTGQVGVLDLTDHEVYTAAPCPGSEATAVAAQPGGARLFVGCASGAVSWLDPDGPGEWALTPAGASVAGPVVGMAANSDAIWVLTGGAGSVVATGLSPATGAATGAQASFALTRELVDVAASDTAIMATAGVGTWSGANLLTGVAITAFGFPAGDYSDVIAADGLVFAAAAGPSGIALYTFGATSGVIRGADAFGDVVAVGAWGGLGLVVDADGGAILRTPLDANGAPEAEIRARVGRPSAAEAGELPIELVDADELAVLGTNAGAIWFLTDAPWVEASAPSAAGGLPGTPVGFTFTSDTAGSYTVRRGALTDSGGVVIAEGFAAAGEEVAVDVEIGDDWDEGPNPLRIVVVDGDDDTVGHDTVWVRLDAPPDAVRLSPDALSFGDQRLAFPVPGQPADDLTHVLVFFDVAPFSAADVAACAGSADSPCGPRYQEPGGPSSPLRVPINSPGAALDVELSPLRNGQTYWIAVRAYDESGLEGPMSNVISGTPRKGLGPAALAGEPGGFACASAPTSGGLWIGLPAIALAAARRRRALAGAGLAALGVGLAPAPARAADAGDGRAELSAAERSKGHIDARYSFFRPDDEAITRVMGESGHDLLWLEWGPHLLKQLELSVGVGWYQEVGSSIAPSGAVTSDPVMLTALPLSVNGTLRLDFFRDQPVVPFAGAGLQMWPWKETFSTTDARTGGGKFGWHWNAGGQILLDALDPRAASRLQARTGIDNTWLTVDYRDQSVGEGVDGLQFSGGAVGLGLKFDY
jgi:MYXO-CTERM domain-containing protein